MLTIIVAAFIIAQTPPDTLAPVFEFLFKVAPLLAALGIFHAGASVLRALWGKTMAAAGKTPTKVDDFLVHLMDPALEVVFDLIDKGDVDGAKKKIDGLRSLVPK